MVRHSQHQDQLQSTVTMFLKNFRIGRLLRQSNITKQAGVPVLELFQFLFTLVFHQRSLKWVLEQPSTDPVGKDTIYRFLNSPRHNWRRFLLLLSAEVVRRFARLTSEERADVFIIDDSLFSRSRSKKVELLARVYAHVSHTFVRGFRMLTLGWSDGNSFVPLCFSLLSSENERNRLCPVNDSVELQGRTYDQMFAHTTIVFTRYIMLSMASREAHELRTIGVLFFDCCDELDDIRFVDALRLLLDLLRATLQAALSDHSVVAEDVIQQFIDRLPRPIKEKLAA